MDSSRVDLHTSSVVVDRHRVALHSPEEAGHTLEVGHPTLDSDRHRTLAVDSGSLHTHSELAGRFRLDSLGSAPATDWRWEDNMGPRHDALLVDMKAAAHRPFLAEVLRVDCSLPCVGCERRGGLIGSLRS